ncbi:MAG: hypothetical protein KDC38_12610, partial [Planctomycetes bacterium]|nr:hypothetical protein [Planctomycetota bacterium]
MYNEPQGFQLYRSRFDVSDEPTWWMRTAVGWPLYLLIAAVVCPIIVSFGGQTEFIYQWTEFASALRSGGFLAWLPVICFAMILGSRFVPSTPVRGMLCAGSGLLFFGTIVYVSSWVPGLFLAAGMSVAV